MAQILKYLNPALKTFDNWSAERWDRFNSIILRRPRSINPFYMNCKKQEHYIHVSLTPEQQRLYYQVAEEKMKPIKTKWGGESAYPITEIFEMLTRLKQICNHPSHYEQAVKKAVNVDYNNDDILEQVFLDEGEESANFENESINAQNIKDFVGKSNKMIKMMEILNERRNRGEKTIIFTQYKMMGAIIEKVLEQQGFSPLFLNGSLEEGKREKILQDFKIDPHNQRLVLITTVKVGGVGLNLFEANNVIHYDQWWNPAVLDQASDRVYRMGQEKNEVNIYILYTENTIEKRIYDILQEKRKIANDFLDPIEAKYATPRKFDSIHDLELAIGIKKKNDVS